MWSFVWQPTKSAKKFIVGGAAAAFLLFIILFNVPGLKAKAADPLRQIIGNEGVAYLETILFGVEDTVHQWQHETGLAEAEAPWQLPTSTPTSQVLTIAMPAATTAPPTTTPTLPPAPTVGVPATTRPTTIPTATPIPSPLPTTTSTPWNLASITPFGTLDGEGTWTPYLHNNANDVVAYRTFLQPDPDRPFTVVGVVAIDLRQTDLHFVLGSQEPSVVDGPHGTGRIPQSEQVAGELLAAFNGGFKATHGYYGAMANGVEALTAKDGLATVVIYADGTIGLGEWGTDIVAAEAMIAWRQNAKMVVSDGDVTAAAVRNSLADWSGSIDNEVVTWRSGLGLSADRQVLYYFAGPSLSMPILGEVMVAVGVHDGMLLDINDYWVHFSAFAQGEDSLMGTPLFSNGMAHHPHRFLRQYERDFFYITVQ